MIRPMLASLDAPPLEDARLVYEPKYDGIRAIAEVGAKVRLWSRLGNEKTQQFPEVTSALERWARRRRKPVVLDGEVVALDGKGEPTGFQQLQGRIHLADGGGGGAVAFIAFDLLAEGEADLCDRPLVERRKALERVFGSTGSPILRISRQVRGDGRALYEEALALGWEGLIAKDAASTYKPGKRTPDWRKLKILQEQEFVIGGWTEPRHSRSHFGALLLGVYGSTQHSAPDTRHPAPDTRHQHPSPITHHPAPGACLLPVGHTGTGFNQRELERVMSRLQAIETDVSPFCTKIKSNERPHWVKPELVAQIRFTEWTADGKLRHPVYLGLRDDKAAGEVRRERGAIGAQGSRGSEGSQGSLIEQLEELEKAGRDGTLTLEGGGTLKVTNLRKIFWPKLKLTKGDLFRYYARVAPCILPAIADRPLVMKRFPNGVAAKPFYQHRAPDVPPGVRVEPVPASAGDSGAGTTRRPHIIGGSLQTLMYTTQLAAISQDPWFSRVQHPQAADHVALDIDPPDDVPFSTVLDVARWIHDELEALGVAGFPKTSGADGLHVYIPLPPDTPYDAGLLFCQIVATVVSQKHPKAATVERSVAARGRRVYVDYLQNILGKTLASAYSARASEYAGVSTPLSWTEVAEGVDRRDFTIATVPARLERVGDLWHGLRASKGADLSRVERYLKKK